MVVTQDGATVPSAAPRLSISAISSFDSGPRPCLRKQPASRGCRAPTERCDYTSSPEPVLCPWRRSVLCSNPLKAVLADVATPGIGHRPLSRRSSCHVRLQLHGFPFRIPAVACRRRFGCSTLAETRSWPGCFWDSSRMRRRSPRPFTGVHRGPSGPPAPAADLRHGDHPALGAYAIAEPSAVLLVLALVHGVFWSGCFRQRGLHDRTDSARSGERKGSASTASPACLRLRWRRRSDCGCTSHGWLCCCACRLASSTC